MKIMPKLTQEEQIKKLDYLTELANKKKTSDLADKLAAFVIFNGFVDFHAIQAARLIEQIVLKSQLAEGKEPTFKPHEDDYFYNKQVSTRRILKVIKELLPFRDEKEPKKDKIINEEIYNFLKVSNKFLDYRNAIIHRLGSPDNSLKDIEYCCNEALSYYEKALVAQKEMSEILQPYRFSEKEIGYFYGDKN